MVRNEGEEEARALLAKGGVLYARVRNRPTPGEAASRRLLLGM